MDIPSNNYLNGRIRETEFKATYVATFLASYMASRYERDCANGTHGAPQPVEDANFLANEAWNEIKGRLGPQ